LPDDAGELDAALDRAFQDLSDSDNLVAAIVLEVSPSAIKAVRSDGDTITISGDALKFAARSLGDKAAPGTRIRRGAVIRAARDDKGVWQIAQMPQVESTFVALRPTDGAIYSLVGGFDFDRSKFNHVTQALRQPGSAFKPFIYSAALEKGFSPATVVNDAPLYFEAAQTGGDAWEPKNYDGKFEGPMRLRTALMKAKIAVPTMMRIMQAITPKYAQDYIARFGFDPKLHPPYLPMGLGAGAATPMQMVAAYAVFANGGYKVTPYLIDRVVDSRGNVLSKAEPAIAGDTAERVIDPRNAFIMTTMMRDVVHGGTAVRAMQLGRQDLAGKTGTTNESVAAWFCGFNAAEVAVAWIGFDQPRTLGSGETGAVAALPIWMAYIANRQGRTEVPLKTPVALSWRESTRRPACARMTVRSPNTFSPNSRHTNARTRSRLPEPKLRKRSATNCFETIVMARTDSPRAHRQRARIAQTAARLIAEHGLTDWSAAKRKACRELGLADNESLPGNEEVEQRCVITTVCSAPMPKRRCCGSIAGRRE
jgi:penicillin-binding protein 1A